MKLLAANNGPSYNILQAMGYLYHIQIIDFYSKN